MRVGVLEAKNRLSELIEAARRGEEVTITKRGEPTARLVATDAPEDRKARALAALAMMDQTREAILARTGRTFSWEENKSDRDEGRP